jgi:hypothetical protein
MMNRILVGGFAAALTGAAMLAISSAPASAFTLASPSLEAPVAGANVDKVWWDRWGRWHPNHPYWGPGWGWHPHRHCWVGPWGHMHCGY